MTYYKHLTATAIAALLATGGAHAQMFDSDTDYLDYQTFNEGFTQSGYYDAWNADPQQGLNEGEFATGVFSDWDADSDLQITEEEYVSGTERWYGAGQDDFVSYDADSSGYLDQQEFAQTWDSELFADWDADADSELSEEEYSTGIYSTADVNQDEVITIEEEGWFEGWFDGDDVEAEIQEVGDVL